MIQNIEIEQSLLGAIIQASSVLSRTPFLEAQHFSEPLHQEIFSVLYAAYTEGKTETVLTLKEKFDGGYLVKLCGAALHVIDAVDYAKHVVELAQKRALAQAINEAQEFLENEETGADTVLSLIARFEEISRGFDGPKIEDDQTVTDRILKGMFEQFAPYPTGIKLLDKAMDGGLYPGKSYGFAAKKKHGKTILAGTISSNLNLSGVKHLFICGEMSPDEIQQRTLARLTDSFPSTFRSGYGKSPHFQRKVAEVAATSKRCILYHNAPGLTFDGLRRVVLSAILQRKIQGFILDYWQLVGGKGKNQSTSEHLDQVAQWIADTCRKYKVWSITMAQINQEGNTRGGEGIRLAFDQVYQIHRPNLSEPATWLEMMDTRYTGWANIGDEHNPGLNLNEKGPFFEEVA